MRRQVYDLTTADLDTAALWQYAIDEEGEEDQDECTVRPRTDLDRFERYEVDLVKTEFVTRSGTKYIGYSTPAETSNLTDIHPVIITEQGQIGFFVGSKPRLGELEEYYTWLNTGPDDLFPIQFRCLAPAPDYVSSGIIPAFVGLNSSQELIEFT